MKITSEVSGGVRVWRAHKPGETRVFANFWDALEWASPLDKPKTCDCTSDGLCNICALEARSLDHEIEAEER